MRTYITPIGYDTRRVTRPVVRTGLSVDDTVLMLRPEDESNPERANQAIGDVESLLQEIESASTQTIQRVSTTDMEATIRDCCSVLTSTPEDSELIVSLSGGPRDILLPLMMASLVLSDRIDQVLFFSDLDQDVQALSLPTLTSRVPKRTRTTFESIVTSDDWLTLTAIAEETGQSKSTVIRHVNDLEEAAVIDADTSERSKRVKKSFSGELLALAWENFTSDSVFH